MGSGRRFLIYQLKMALHQLPVALTGYGMPIWVECCKDWTGGKVISLNRATQRSRTKRREFMGEERKLETIQAGEGKVVDSHEMLKA